MKIFVSETDENCRKLQDAVKKYPAFEVCVMRERPALTAAKPGVVLRSGFQKLTPPNVQ